MRALRSAGVTLIALASDAKWPGHSSTASYALGATAGHIRVRPDHNERTVSLRMERQRRLFANEDSLQLTVLLEEVVLDRPIGGKEVLRGQLEQVMQLVEHDNIEVRVLPTDVGYHEALIGPFTVLDFAKAQSIAYVELVNGAVYVQDQDQVNGYNRTIDRLREVALSPEETVTVIQSRLTT